MFMQHIIYSLLGGISNRVFFWWLYYNNLPLDNRSQITFMF